ASNPSAVPAGTDAGVASDTAGEKRGVPKLAWLGAAALVVGLGVGFVVMKSSSHPAAQPEDAPTAPASTGPTVTAVTATPAPPSPPEAPVVAPQVSGAHPTVTPQVSVSQPAPSALPSPSASAAKHERHPDGKVSAPPA